MNLSAVGIKLIPRLLLSRSCCLYPSTSNSARALSRSCLHQQRKTFKEVSIPKWIQKLKSTPSAKGTGFLELVTIAKLMVPHSGRILLGIAFLGVSSTIGLLMPRILGRIIDIRAIGDENKLAIENDFTYKISMYFKQNLISLLGVTAFGAIAFCARIYLMHTAAQLVINDLRTKLFGSLLRQDVAFFDRNKAGEIVSRLSTDAYIVGNAISSNLGNGTRSIVALIGTATLMIITSPQLCWVGLWVAPIVFGSLSVFGKLEKKYTIQMQAAIASMNHLSTERLSNIKMVKTLVSEMKELSFYRSKVNDIWDISKKEGFAQGLLLGGLQFTAYGTLAALIYYGNILIAEGVLTVGDLTSFTLYALMCAGSISGLSGFYTELMKGLGASKRLFEMQNQTPRIVQDEGRVISSIHDSISFKSVAFSYPDSSKVLSDITFSIPVGSITAIVGRSGTGKSTLAHLLLRFYDPTEGRILVDDCDLRDLHLHNWRRMVGTVSQEPVLFSTTIRENITYGMKDDEVTEDKLLEAIEQANCMEFVKALPKGLDSPVGEFGSSLLSGGQKQRIAIARALITKPHLLILDEATSALDAASEYFIRRTLSNLFSTKKQTAIIIAHRLSTIKQADQIVVLDRGTVSEIGTFDELMSQKKGIFRSLVDKQTINWRDDKY